MNSKEKMREIVLNKYPKYTEKTTRKKRKRKKGELQGRDFLREKVRIRDNYTCQKCGKKWGKGQRRLDIHHLDEQIEGEKAFIYKNNKDINKMITLCHKCHLNLYHIRNKISFSLKGNKNCAKNLIKKRGIKWFKKNHIELYNKLKKENKI